MSVTVVVGGQFGGEGKGKITSYLCREHNYHVAVRCGGPNSGHTITVNNKPFVLRQIPAGVINPSTMLFLSAGCLINLDVFFTEFDAFNLDHKRVKVDNNAVIVDGSDIAKELETGLKLKIGSTCCGVGSAVARRILRSGNVKLAKDIPNLKPFLTNVAQEINVCVQRGEKVVIEGTQGFGLSVYHSPYYPFTTSRDTTAAAFLSEAGVSPMSVSEIIMVVRTFPIRVGGNSGPLANELTWRAVEKESGYPFAIQEFTTVTKQLRRVGRLDIGLIKDAVIVNRPTKLAVMGIDYIDYANKSIVKYDALSKGALDYITWLEEQLGVEVCLIGTGPNDSELVVSPREARW